MSIAVEENRQAGGGMTAGNIVRMAVVGVVGWALAALFIRFANQNGLFQGAAEIVLFALCFPVAWGTARAMRRSGRLAPDQLVPGMAIALIAALFLDGTALTMAPWIYGASDATLLPAAAWLLFGVGAFLAAAFLEARRDIAGG
jgi:hypothetical protein